MDPTSAYMQLVQKHGQEYANFENAKKLELEALESRLQNEKNKGNDEASTTLINQLQESIDSFITTKKEEQLQLYHKHQQEREIVASTNIPDNRPDNYNPQNPIVNKKTKRGYRKRSGYQHRRREAWNNLIMTIGGRNSHRGQR